MPTLAIVGSGISGLASAYFLSPKFDVTVFERNDYVGGHTNTATVDEEGTALPIDTGFMVFNESTYPNLSRFFRDLGIRSKPTDMSFSVQHCPSSIEWSGTGFNRLFGDRKNIFNLRFWRMLLQLNRFNKEALDVGRRSETGHLSIAQYARTRKYGQDFLDLYLIPMSSALWSTAPGRIEDFPAISLLNFFHNHGLLAMHSQYPWLTVDGGAKTYVQALLTKLNLSVHTKSAVQSVRRNSLGVEVLKQDGQSGQFDACVMACHADQALALIDQPSGLEKELLSAFRYQNNPTSLHSDDSVMPRLRRNWSAWNHRTESESRSGQGTSTHYWMNRLQGISKKRNYFVSLNAGNSLHSELVYRQYQYEHPIFTVDSLKAQERLSLLNKQSIDQKLFFCGSYFKYGFHEDAFTSALEMSRIIRGEPIWC